MIRRTLLDFLRLTEQAPVMPVGAHRVLSVERASPGYLRLLYFRWGLRTLLEIGAAVLFLVLMRTDGEPHWALLAVEAVAMIGILGRAVFGAFVIRLDYELRWYLISDRSLMIREGVWNVREITLTFANVQNVTVTQGPVERLFGVSTIEVTTAGGAGAAQQQQGGQAVRNHSGHLRGLADPHRVRDRVLELIRSERSSGLGDPDDDARTAAPTTHGVARGAFCPAALDALREAAVAARRLRSTLSRG